MMQRMAADPTASPSQYIREHIRTVPDWTAPGVMFGGATPLPLFTLVAFAGH